MMCMYETEAVLLAVCIRLTSVLLDWTLLQRVLWLLVQCICESTNYT